MDSVRGLLDSNGAGKTTLLNAISLALFCHAPTGKGSTFQSHGAAFWEVEFVLTSPDEDIIIKRKVKGSRHQLWVTIKSRTDPKEYGPDVQTAQEALNRRIGCDWALFKSVMFLTRQGDTTQFLFQTPAKRAEVLSTLIDDSDFRVGADILKGRVRELENLKGLHGNELMGLRQQMGLLEQDIARAAEAGANWEAQEKVRLTMAQAQFASYNNQLAAVSTRLLEARTFLQGNQFAEVSRQHGEAGSAIQRLQRDVAVLHEDLRRQTSAAYLERHKAACPTCAQPIPPHSIAEVGLKTAKLQAELAGRNVELQAQNGAWTSAQQLLARVQQSTQEIRALEERADTLHQQALFAKDELAERRSDYLDGQVFELTQRRAEGLARIAWLEQALYATEVSREAHAYVRAAFGGEVRNLMFDFLRGPLEEWTHFYVGQLIDTGISIQFPHQDAKEKFEILVWNGQHKQDLSVYSGGEIWRIAIAILLALRKVLAQNSGCKLDFLLCDDFAGELDDCGIVEVLSAFQQLTKSDISTILFAIPRRAYIPAIPHHTVEVTRKGGQSAITATT